MGAVVFGAGWAGTHLASLMAGIAVFKLSKPALVPLAMAMAVWEGYAHGAPIGEAVAIAFETDRKTSNKVMSGFCVGAGMIAVGLGATIKNIPAAEFLIVGGVGKAVAIGGTVVSAMGASCFYSFGEGIVEAARRGEGKNPIKNMFYKEDIKEMVKGCTTWMKNKINELGEPIKDIADVWKSPSLKSHNKLPEHEEYKVN